MQNISKVTLLQLLNSYIVEPPIMSNSSYQIIVDLAEQEINSDNPQSDLYKIALEKFKNAIKVN